MKFTRIKLFFTLLAMFFIGLGYSLYPDIVSGDINPIKQVSAMFEKEDETHYFEVEPIVTNLKQNSSHKQNYISLHLTFEVLGDDDLKLIKEKEPVIRDAMIDFLSNQSMADLLVRDDEELSTKDYIVENMQLLINEKLNTDKKAIKNILITDMFLQ